MKTSSPICLKGILLWGFFLLFFNFGGCGDGGGGTENFACPGMICLEVGPEGGNLEVPERYADYAGIAVNFPPQACENKIRIIINSARSGDFSAPPTGVIPLGEPMELLPDGFQFSKSVTVTIPDRLLNLPDNIILKNCAVYLIDQQGWREVSTTLTGDSLTAEVTHFCYFQVGGKPTSPATSTASSTTTTIKHQRPTTTSSSLTSTLSSSSSSSSIASSSEVTTTTTSVSSSGGGGGGGDDDEEETSTTTITTTTTIITTTSSTSSSITTTASSTTTITTTTTSSSTSSASSTTSAIDAPAAPANLSATAVSDRRIDLSWTDNADNEDGIKIERKTGAGGVYSQIAIVDPQVTNYSDTGLNANTKYFYRARAYNAGGDSSYSNEASAATHLAEPLYVLLVDDDNGEAFESYFTDALNQGGYSYDVWDISLDGDIDADTLFFYLSGAVIWTTGLSFTDTLSNDDQSNLSAFLDAGGRLFLSSQDVLYDSNVASAFKNNKLHAASWTSDVGYTQVIGVPGDPVSEGQSYDLTPVYNNWVDDVVPDANSEGIFTHNSHTYFHYAALRNSNPATLSRLVFFAFPFEFIVDLNDRTALMENILSWFDASW